jgi:hypothetical protein
MGFSGMSWQVEFTIAGMRGDTRDGCALDDSPTRARCLNFNPNSTQENEVTWKRNEWALYQLANLPVERTIVCVD